MHLKILILHLTMFLDQINLQMHLLFMVIALRSNIKFKSQNLGDNNQRLLVKIPRFLINKFLNKKNKFAKEGILQKVHLILVFLLQNLQNKLNVNSIKCHKKRNY